MSRGIIRDLLTYGAGRIFPAVLSMVFTLVCVQTLTAEEYAKFSLGVLPALIAAAFVGGLAGQPLLRFGTRLDRKGLDRALWSVPLVGALISVPPVLVWWGMNEATWTVVLPFSLLLIPAISLTDARRCYLVASSQPEAVLRFDSIRTFINLMLLWLFFLLPGFREVVPVAAMLSGSLFALLTSSPRRSSAVSENRIHVDRNYLGYGVWAACWMALIAMFPLAERHMLQVSHGLGIAGIYSAISDPALTLMAAGTSVVVSAVSAKLVAGWDAGDRVLVRVLTLTGILAASALAAVAWLVGAVIAEFKIGRLGTLLHDYPALATAMLIVTAAWQFAVFVHKPLELMRRVDLMFGALLLSLIVFAGAGLLLVGPWQGMGLLMAKSIALFVYVVTVKVAVHVLNRKAA